MNMDSDCNMAPVSSGNGKLRQWLIDQIDSGKYPGLIWENEDKSIFRIPWKHAGKQDYNRDEDAALFKAWALFKGKFREGIDKQDPPTWKTRLRCALNKSNDFDELVDRSQLDISDPYKVYKIIPEGAKKGGSKQVSMDDPQILVNHHPYPTYSSMPPQLPNYIVPHERSWREYEQQHPELAYQCSPVPFATRNHHWQGPGCENDCRLQICLYYRDTLVREVTTTSPEGCRIAHVHDDKPFAAGNIDQVLFPYPDSNAQRKGIDKLLNHLEKGVLLWMTPDGLYAKRLCQSRIYWEGPLAPYNDRPNKLERDQVTKLFDTQQFLIELQSCAHHGRTFMPRYQIVFCFGEEFPDPQRSRKLITAHIEPVLAKQLYYFTQQNSGHLLRGYEVPDHVNSVEDYHRSIRHSIQD
ncbi:interferon regulatory factor 4-like isoform X2 [Rhinoraja longicauda]